MKTILLPLLAFDNYFAVLVLYLLYYSALLWERTIKLETNSRKKSKEETEKKNYLISLRLKLRCLGSVITRCFFSPLENDNSKEGEKAKRDIITPAFYIILSFFLGLARLNFGIYPFGLSIITSSKGGKSFYCFCGASFACLFMGSAGIIPFITYFLIFLIRKSISGGRFDEELIPKLAISFFSAMFIGACGIAVGTASSNTWLSYITYMAISVICTYLFSAFPGFESGKSSAEASLLSIYSICVCLIPAFSRFSVSFLQADLLFAAFITLWFSRDMGCVYGCICGFITGFACANPLLSAPLGISAVFSGYLFRKSFIVSNIVFFISALFVGIYQSGTGAFIHTLPTVMSSAIIFTLISPKLPGISSRKTSKTSHGKAKKTVPKSEFEKVSDSLSGLSSIIYKFAEHMKSPSHSETGTIFDNAFNDICKNCSLNDMCYAKRECNFSAVRNKVISVLHSGKLSEKELSSLLLDKCIKTGELCEHINSRYSELNFVTMKSNRTQTVACLYNSMSNLIKSTSKEENDNNTRDSRLENLLSEALKKMGIEFTYITASGTRCKDIFIHGIKADKIPCSSKDLADFLSDECGMELSQPSFDISDSADMVMHITRQETVCLEYAQCCEAKTTGNVNGDTVCFFDTDKNLFYSIISDGMGSGKTAAATSRLSCVFLEKMLKSGASKTVCLEMLNNLLLSKNDETFSGIDLLEIDKLNGSAYFIKAGAAPSFVLRKSRLYKICSQTPPVGIIPSFCAESTRFALEKDDIIIMVSDGVIQSDSDGVWLSELIHLDTENEPAFLASKLIEKSKEINIRRDDASACVIKIN